jgi:hypothetical protein
MYESDAIVEYLFKEYGDGAVPLALRMGPLTTLTCGLALAPRWGPGAAGRAARGGAGRKRAHEREKEREREGGEGEQTRDRVESGPFRIAG